MPTNVPEWERMAAYWDQKQGDGGDLWHRALIDPTVLRLLGSVAGLRVLDLACGNGYFARLLARQGARVTGVDASAPIVARAAEREGQEPLGIAYHVADAACLDPLPDQAFDLVLCHMGLMDMADAAGAIREAARVLRPQGRFVASLSHPCFDVVSASAWVLESTGSAPTLWRKVSRYREAFQGWVFWRVGPEEVWQTPGYHRPLSWYVRALRAAGFVVTALEEPEPTEEFLREESPQGPWISQIPLHCVLEARKVGDGFPP